MAEPTRTFNHIDEFLAWEAQQPERWEFFDGVARMMMGGTFNHAHISGGIYSALKARLRGGGCNVFIESIKLKAAGSIFYPDVLVVCPGFDRDGTVAERATLIVEVLSPSARGREASRKLLHYMQMPDLKAIILLEQDEWAGDVYRRVGGVWVPDEVSGPDDVIRLDDPALSIPLSEIYADSLA